MVGAAALSVGVAACGGSSSSGHASGASSGASSGAAADTIVIKNFGYAPSNLTVTAGAKVTVKNEDTATHTVTADSGAFDTGDISPGHSATFTAPKAGHYAYHCAIHNFMHGTLTVSG